MYASFQRRQQQQQAGDNVWGSMTVNCNVLRESVESVYLLNSVTSDVHGRDTESGAPPPASSLRESLTDVRMEIFERASWHFRLVVALLVMCKKRKIK